MARVVTIGKLIRRTDGLASILEATCTSGVQVLDATRDVVFEVGNVDPTMHSELVPVELGDWRIATTRGPDSHLAASLLETVGSLDATNRALGGEVLGLYRQTRILIALTKSLATSPDVDGVAVQVVAETERALPDSRVAFIDVDGNIRASSEGFERHRNVVGTTPNETVIRQVGAENIIMTPVIGAREFGHLRVHRHDQEFLMPDANLVSMIAAIAAPALGRAEVNQRILSDAAKRQDELARTVELLREELDMATTKMLATIIFTDIVDSTATQARVGDADWAQLIEAHNREAERLLSRHGGTLMEFTGDGFCARFDSPTRTLHCATEFRSFITSLGLGIRVGMHTGEVEVRGSNISGITLNIAARIMSQAGDGEILISAVTTDVVGAGEFSFGPKRTTELKGLPGRWQMLPLL